MSVVRELRLFPPLVSVRDRLPRARDTAVKRATSIFQSEVKQQQIFWCLQLLSLICAWDLSISPLLDFELFLKLSLSQKFLVPSNHFNCLSPNRQFRGLNYKDAFTTSGSFQAR